MMSCNEVSVNTNSENEKQKEIELRKVVEKVWEDANNSNIQALKDAHLNSPKFSKFGPRMGQRQNVTTTNMSETEHFLLKKQEINQPDKERNFEANYPSFQEFASAILPSSLTINALQKNVKTTIIIDYDSFLFNEELNFPYSVPNGYDRIFIK